MNNDVIENYRTLENIDQELKFMTKSVIRLKIMQCLEKASYTIKELEKKTGICYSSVSTNLNKLESRNYILKKEKRFNAKPLTSIYLNMILDFDDSLKTIAKFEKLWNNHVINEFDEESMINLTSLLSSELIESSPTDIYKTHNILKKQMKNSKHIKLIFPYIHPDYSKLIKNALKKNSDIEIITSKELLNRFIYEIDKKSERKGKLKIIEKKITPNIYLTICDNEMSLGLFKKDGSFDQNRLLVSNNSHAVKWAEELFKNIKRG